MRLINIQKLHERGSPRLRRLLFFQLLLTTAELDGQLPLDAAIEKQRIFHSRDPDEARAFLSGKEFRFDLSHRAAKQLDMRINGIYLPSIYIGYIQYGLARRNPDQPARNDYWLQIPIQEHIEVTVARECIACGPDRAAVSSPTRCARDKGREGAVLGSTFR